MSKMRVNLIMDAWIREAEEASQWLEDLESRVNHTSVSVVDSAPSKLKLLELGVKLDRLESLLRNPPTKPILTDDDLNFRWKMLSDIQQRTRTLAHSLYALPCPNRPRNVPATGNTEYSNSTDCYDQDLMRSPYSQDHSELLKPLLSDDESRSQVQACTLILDITVNMLTFHLCIPPLGLLSTWSVEFLFSLSLSLELQIQPFSFMPMISPWKACSTIVLFFGLAAILLLVVNLCTAI